MKSFFKSESEVKRIVDKQLQLLQNDQNLLQSKYQLILSELDELLSSPKFMFILCEIHENPCLIKLINSSEVLKLKIESLKNPDVKLFQKVSDKSFIFNMRLSLLINKMKVLDSISLENLSKELSTSEFEFGVKDTQKLVMKAIQLNLVKATIDKKTNFVYFL